MDFRRVENLPEDLILEVLLRCEPEVMRDLTPFCLQGGFRRTLSVLQDPDFTLNYQRFWNSRHGTFLLAYLEAEKGWVFSTSMVLDPASTALLCSSSHPTRHMEYADGLLCSGFGQVRTIVINPATGRVTTLPRFPVESPYVEVKSYLGFDPSISSFKVLGMCRPLDDSVDHWVNHHVLTMTADKPSSWMWRPVNCSVPHAIFPMTYEPKSLCLEGNLSYTARLPSQKQFSVIRFNLSTETFSESLIPEKIRFGIPFWASALLEVGGKVGVSFQISHGTYRIWVLQNQEINKWSQLIIQAPLSILSQLRDFPLMAFEGLTRRGLSVFSQGEGTSLCLYYHDTVRNRVWKHKIFGAYRFDRFTFFNFGNTDMFA